MNYDKLSRSLRYYYEKGIMQKVIIYFDIYIYNLYIFIYRYNLYLFIFIYIYLKINIYI